MSQATKTTKSGPSGYQTTYAMLRESLRDTLRDGTALGAGTAESIRYRASAALYALLGAHQVDRRGRCRSCRRRGALLTRRTRCRIYIDASYWLRQPDQAILHSHLASELKQDTSWSSHNAKSLPGRSAPYTDLPVPAEPPQTLAIPCSPPRGGTSWRDGRTQFTAGPG